MLKLVDIKKDYVVADTKVHALRGVNLCFRKNEFVSVLGPSGCGKTTLLNIIGGLDHCTSGDLVIYGKSTKQYKDRDWDVYRNHRIGFVFQSYNLIPHQTVLGNVELALTIAGMSKSERVEKAKAALDKVGLSDQYYKKPNQLSGGQCQRVAIARSLVNDPEILLADEPTGALDTVTSKQIMELVKEISKERLVIMVTHNPELAEEYSTRIIKLLDGNLLDDTNPFSESDEKAETDTYLKQQAEQEQAVLAAAAASGAKKGRKKERAKMSFFTSFKLSLQNLFTKKRRSIMTAIAGSIGIIGVSLVLSVSIGLQGFINDMQNDMLAGYPIEIYQTGFDINSMMSSSFSMGDAADIAKKGDWVNVEQMIYEVNKQLSEADNMQYENTIDLDYVTYVNDMPQEYWSAIFMDYGLDVTKSIYSNYRYPTHEAGRETSVAGIRAMYSSVLLQIEGFESFAPFIDMLDSAFMQAPDTNNPVTEEYLQSQYNVLYSREGTNGIAKNKNEVMIVLDKDRAIADLTLGQIGYYGQDEFINIVQKALEDKKIEDGEITGYEKHKPAEYDGGQIPYEKLMDLTFNWYPNNTIFNENSRTSNTPFTYLPYADEFTANPAFDPENVEELTVVGILELKEDHTYGMMQSGVYYTTALAEHIVQENWKSKLAVYLREFEKAESLAGTATILKKDTELRFEDENDIPTYIPKEFFTQSNGEWVCIIPFDILFVVNGKIIPFDYEYIFDDMTVPEKVKGIVDSPDNMFYSMISMFLGEENDVSMVSYSMTKLGGNVEANIVRNDSGKILSWEVIMNGDDVYALPYGMAVYPPDFRQKDKVLNWLDAWNDEKVTITLSTGKVLLFEDRQEIKYSDILSLIMNMISSLLTMVTIALVGFTSLALVVSCVMIGIITYVSVVERIKEIGVIRSLGGRKRDVSNLFTAETFIIGLASGLIGIIVTYILSFILNLIVHSAGIASIAFFPWWVAAIMVGISIGLTLISGLMPSRSAAKKDPVVALRTE